MPSRRLTSPSLNDDPLIFGTFAPEHLSGVKKAEQDGVKW